MTRHISDTASDTAPDASTDTATDAAPILAGLLTDEGAADPHPLFERARTLGPVVPAGDGILLVTGYQEAERLTRDRAFGILSGAAREPADPGSAPAAHLSRRIVAASLLETDPPHHTRLRSLVSSFFAGRRIRSCEALIAAEVDDLLDGMPDHANPSGTVDFMEAFASRLPMRVICELLGVPRADRLRFRAAASALTLTLELAPPPDAVAAADQAVAELVEYFADLAARRRADPRDDLASALASAAHGPEPRLSGHEMLSMFVLLLVAGFDTTVNLLGNATALALQHPLAADELRTGRTPAAGFTDEVLRLESPVQYAARVPLRAGLAVGGVPAPLGTIALVFLGAANRDPRQYDRPAEFDPLRTGPQPLAFGGGAHFCLGAPLARLEGNIALPALLRRFPRLRPAGEPVRRRGLMMRGHERLPVTLG
ncbi:cytochrome P450 [Streptomyces sp. NPDC101175]|uniref:cytochrome P450 n=1 Tax=Streptomyces sp. NPDC101175 TaxID=3366123 RepID=UPI0038337FD3